MAVALKRHERVNAFNLVSFYTATLLINKHSVVLIGVCCHVCQFVVVLYNPFGRNVSMWVRVPVSGKSYTVSDYKQHPVGAQVCSR